jgi:hypothetical protein
VDDDADRPAALCSAAHPGGGRWRLYWDDRTPRWYLMGDVPPAVTPAPLLAELDADPTGIFWGYPWPASPSASPFSTIVHTSTETGYE